MKNEVPCPCHEILPGWCHLYALLEEQRLEGWEADGQQSHQTLCAPDVSHVNTYSAQQTPEMMAWPGVLCLQSSIALF
jgi:hypothetical protein